MKKLFLWALSALLTLPAAAQDFVPEASFYGENYWTPDTLGNHRAIVSVNTPASVAEAYIPWRRRDANPEQKGIIVINVSTGKAVDNVLPVEINREYGRIRFDASGNAGDYYVYYLPYHTSGGPYPKVNYPQQPDKADPQWKATCKATPAGKAVQAKLVRFESLGSFNSFYPMEIIATAQEKQALIDANSNKPFLLLPEDRKYPIRMFDDLSYRQVTQGATGEFFGEADLNEYYVLQLGLWAFKNPVNGVKVTFTDLKGRNESIPASALTCFNTEGTDWLGRPIHPEVNVGKGRVQPLWIGIQMPEHAGRGIYRGTVTVSDLSGASQVRELTNHAPELFALKSLGHEIFSPGKGGGYAWLQEHLDGDYIGAWFVDAYKDAAIVNTGISRWHNFYVEGLNWLTKMSASTESISMTWLSIVTR